MTIPECKIETIKHIEYEDLDESRKMLPIKLYAKPKVGQVWSAQTANELISDNVNRLENNMNRAIERFSGYAEV